MFVVYAALLCTSLRQQSLRECRCHCSDSLVTLWDDNQLKFHQQKECLWEKKVQLQIDSSWSNENIGVNTLKTHLGLDQIFICQIWGWSGMYWCHINWFSYIIARMFVSPEVTIERAMEWVIAPPSYFWQSCMSIWEVPVNKTWCQGICGCSTVVYQHFTLSAAKEGRPAALAL